MPVKALEYIHERDENLQKHRLEVSCNHLRSVRIHALTFEVQNWRDNDNTANMEYRSVAEARLERGASSDYLALEKLWML